MISGKSIKNFRKRIKLRQSVFADSLNISVPHLSEIEHGRIECASPIEACFFSLYNKCFNYDEKEEFKKNCYDENRKLLSGDIVNFIITNDLDNIMNEIISLKLDKRVLKVLFSDTLNTAKTLKKTRS